MSQLKVNSIVDASGGSNAVLYGPASPAGSMGFRNRIINGDMRIDQRNAGASGTGTSTYATDRWKFDASQSGKWTWGQNLNSVTPPAGFTNYMGVESDSAYSISSTDYFVFRQFIEGYNSADFAWGSASAKTVTLSFWVRSSLTGTFGGAFSNSTYGRCYPFTYTISVADTWEYKTVVVSGDTSGTWLTNNGKGVTVEFGLGVGATYSGTAGSWSSNIYDSATGAVSVVGTNGATWYITGVQLEVGSVATEFERRPYGTELALCQRYYIRYNNAGATTSNQAYLIGVVGSSTTSQICSTNFANPMRTNPTGSYSGGIRIYDGSTAPAVTSITAQESSPSTGTLSFAASGGGLTTGRVALIIPNGSSAGYVDFSAEL